MRMYEQKTVMLFNTITVKSKDVFCVSMAVLSDLELFLAYNRP